MNMVVKLIIKVLLLNLREAERPRGKMAPKEISQKSKDLWTLYY